jgi:hypothetical protein
MHSQLMFNECIARSIEKMSTSTSMSPIFQYVWRPVSKYGFGVRCRKRIELSYLPAADTEKEAEDIGLLLLLKLLNVLKRAHSDRSLYH